jgi:hypothetical protein
MQRRKIDFTKKLKLSELSQENEHHTINNYQNNLNLIKKENNAKPVSFRLRKIDMDRLLSSLTNANDINESHPFNRTDLLRGLILLATELDPKKTLNYIRQSL